MTTACVRPTALPDVLLIETQIFRDGRGHFRETWREAEYAAAGLPGRFVQDNVSCSRRHVLRGLHAQHPGGQGKLVSVLAGTIFDVAVDIRWDAPTFGQWIGETLDAEMGRQLYVPPGCAHGFVVLSEQAIVSYKCTTAYLPASEVTVRWNDPRIGIRWPVEHPIVSPKDAGAPCLAEYDRTCLPGCDVR